MPNPDSPPLPQRSLRQRTGRFAAWLTLTAVLLAGLHVGGELNALARMTGNNASGGEFGQLKTYLDNLQKSLLPLAIPLGTIGLAGGGVAYMLGHHMAQKILGGVIAGTALVLLSPQLMA